MIFARATNNKKKLAEIERILLRYGHQVKTLNELGISIEIAETGKTFAENALIKAKTIADICKMPTISDDSGLEVDALGGRPGVYTARYAGENATDDDNIDKLLKSMENVPQEKRTARFVSCVCLYIPGNLSSDDKHIICTGTCEGHIAFERMGVGGFGYDPVFMVGDVSYSQMNRQEKDAVSHRGQAMRILEEKVKTIKFD